MFQIDVHAFESEFSAAARRSRALTRALVDRFSLEVGSAIHSVAKLGWPRVRRDFLCDFLHGIRPMAFRNTISADATVGGTTSLQDTRP